MYWVSKAKLAYHGTTFIYNLIAVDGNCGAVKLEVSLRPVTGGHAARSWVGRRCQVHRVLHVIAHLKALDIAIADGQ